MTQTIKISPPNLSAFQRRIFTPATTYLATRQGESRILAICGRRKGKTFGVVNSFIPSAFANKVYLAFGAYSERTTRGGWREIVTYCSDFIKQFGSKGWRFAPEEDGSIRFPSGSTWDRISFTTADAGRGMTFHAAHIDEVQLIPHGNIAPFLPTLATTQGLACFTGTAPKTWKEWNDSQWWIKIIKADAKERAEKYPEYVVIHEPTYPEDIGWAIREEDRSSGRSILPFDEYKRLGQRQLNIMRSEMGSEWYKREVDVVLEPPLSGLIFSNFSNVRIGEYGFDPSLGGKILVAIDRGWGLAKSVILFCQKYTVTTMLDGEPIKKNVYRIFAEKAYTGSVSSPTIVKAAFAGIPPGHQFMFFPDPRAKDIHYELDMLGAPSFRPNVMVNDGNEIVNTRMENGEIEIDARASLLISQARQYTMLEDGEPMDTNNDTCDALRYLIANDRLQSGDSQIESAFMIREMAEAGIAVGVGYLPLF